MFLKILMILTFIYVVNGRRNFISSYSCSERSALLLLKRPAYEFSMQILDRVTQSNDAHFVFSPLSSWLQLSALAEGAEGRTLKELWNLTRHHRNKCFKIKLRRMLRKHSKGLNEEYRRNSVVIIDQFMGVKKRYMRDVQNFYGAKVLLKNFDSPNKTTAEVNSFISKGTKGIIEESVYVDDFNQTSGIVLSDNVLLRSAWIYPFNKAETQNESFVSSSGVYLGNVNMMSMIGYINITDMKNINARVVELPCVGDFSMLILIPLNKNWIGDTFYLLKDTTMAAIFNRFKAEGPKLVNLKLPRFRISSVVDNLPEMLFDMNVRSVFDLNVSELSHISDHKLFASLMTQVADIEVTEEGVRASVSPGNIVDASVDFVDFIANRPFAYMLVDRRTQFVLFAGVYSEPSVY